MLAAPRFIDRPGTDNNFTGLVTWRRLTNATDEFITLQMAESYAVIWPWHIRNEGFLAGIDLAAVAAEYEELTGWPFPDLPCVPDPKPVTAGSLADFPFAEMHRMSAAPRRWTVAMNAADAYQAWKRSHGLT